MILMRLSEKMNININNLLSFFNTDYFFVNFSSWDLNVKLLNRTGITNLLFITTR